MKTPKLVVTAVVLAVVPPLVSLGCNKKEDAVPAPSATAAPVPPPPVATTATAAQVVPQPVAVAPIGKPLPKADAGARADAGALRLDAGALAALKFDAAGIPPFPTALPTTLPNIQPSALPAIASGIVGGIISALPSGVVPVPSR